MTRALPLVAVVLGVGALQFRPKGKSKMLTVFFVDGDRLLATHYRSAKNQPHLATAPNLEPDATRFFLVRVTGLVSPDDWHNTGLVLTIHDHDHMTQDWTCSAAGRTGTTVFHFSRER